MSAVQMTKINEAIQLNIRGLLSDAGLAKAIADIKAGRA